MTDQLSTKHAERLQDLFDAALDLDPDQRESYVRDSGSDLDPEFVDRVLSLLNAFDDADSVLQKLERPKLKLIDPALRDPLELIGKKFQGYEIVTCLGAGGMGVVYKAFDQKLLRHVAIKLLSPHSMLSQDAKERFIREARAASPLDHPNIATVHDIGEMEDGGYFIVMAHYEGETLKEIIKRGPIELKTAVDYGVQIARGLEKAHEHGIIHRDIKPANLMVTLDGTVKILDFGLAHVQDSGMTQTGAIMGTPKYMSPEQSRGDGVDERTDIWSFGAVFYEMLTGNSRREELSTSDLIPRELKTLLGKTIHPSPNRRHINSKLLLNDFESVQARFLPPTKFSLLAKLSLSAVALALFIFGIYSTAPEFGRLAANQAGFRILPTKKSLAVVVASHAGEDELKLERERHFLTSLTPRIRQLSTLDPNFRVGKFRTTTSFTSADTQVLNEKGHTLVLSVSAGVNQQILELTDTKSGRRLRQTKIDLNLSIFEAVEEAIAIISSWMSLTSTDERSTRDFDKVTGYGAVNYYDRAVQEWEEPAGKKNLDIVTNHLESAIRLDSTMAVAHAKLAEVYWSRFLITAKGSWKNLAESRINHALILEPNSKDAVLALAKMKIDVNLYGEGRHLLNDIYNRKDIDAPTYVSLGMLYMKLNDSEMAEAAFLRATELRTDYVIGNAYLAWFYELENEYVKALQYSRLTQSLDSTYFVAFITEGAVLNMMGRELEAIPVLKKALQLNSTSSANEHLGHAYFSLGNHESALEYYTRYANSDSTNHVGWMLVADIHAIQKREHISKSFYTVALKFLREKLENTPMNRALLGEEAKILSILGENDLALVKLRFLESLNPNSSEVLIDIGHSYERMGERKLAVKKILNAIENGADTSQIKKHPLYLDLYSTEIIQQAITNQ